MPSLTGIEMGTSNLTRYLRLPGRALRAFLRCDAAVAAAVVERELLPLRGRKRYEYAVRRFLTRRFGEIIAQYKDSEYCIWPLPEDASVWVYLTDESLAQEQQLIGLVRREVGDRPIHPLNRQNYTEHVSLPDSVVEQLRHFPEEQFNGLLCYALLYQRGGTFVSQCVWQSSRKGNPAYGYAFDMLIACHAARLPIVDDELPAILHRMAEEQIPCLKAARRMLNQLIKHSHGEFRFMDYEWQPL